MRRPPHWLDVALRSTYRDNPELGVVLAARLEAQDEPTIKALARLLKRGWRLTPPPGNPKTAWEADAERFGLARLVRHELEKQHRRGTPRSILQAQKNVAKVKNKSLSAVQKAWHQFQK